MRLGYQMEAFKKARYPGVLKPGGWGDENFRFRELAQYKTLISAGVSEQKYSKPPAYARVLYLKLSIKRSYADCRPVSPAISQRGSSPRISNRIFHHRLAILGDFDGEMDGSCVHLFKRLRFSGDCPIAPAVEIFLND